MTLSVDLATSADDPAIRGLLRRHAMPGRVILTYEREPSFWLGCEVTGENCQVMVARETAHGEIVGLASRSTRRAFVNGHEQRFGYLSDLRVDRRFRGRWLVSRGFSLLRRLHDADPVPGFLASIVDGNREASGVLVHRRRRLFPVFHPVADYCSLAIDVRGSRPQTTTVSPSRDLARIARFLQTHGPRRQFFPVWTEDALRRLTAFGLRMEDLRVAGSGDEIIGVAGLWDQSAYKQMVVHGYTRWLKAAAWLGLGALPRPGEALRSAYAALICVANDDTAVFRALLRDLYNLAAARGLRYLLVGLEARDPLLPVAREYGHVVYPSRLYLAEWPDGGHFYERLDERPVYMDIATL